MGDGSILFDETTWKTHILTTTAAIVYEALIEQSDEHALRMDEAKALLRNALGLDPDNPDITQLLVMLKKLGVIRE